MEARKWEEIEGGAGEACRSAGCRGHVRRRYTGGLQFVLNADGDHIFFIPFDMLRDLKGKGQVSAFMRTDLGAIDVNSAGITCGANAQEHALPLPALRHVCSFNVPCLAEVIEEIFVLFVPTPGDSHRAWFLQPVEPAILFACSARIYLEIPYA